MIALSSSTYVSLAGISAIDPRYLKWAGSSCLVLGLFGIAFVVGADPNGLPRRYWIRYLAYLERKLHRMFIWSSGRRIVFPQIGALVLIAALVVGIDLPVWYLFAAAVIFGPAYYIEKMRQKRVVEIESQIDGFMMALANALKSTPSLGDAFRSVQFLLRDPIRQEVQLAVKEMRVGATLEQALLLMASRVGSRQLDSALSAVLIGRQVGGNLPKILETTAMSLREMSRLEGVVRTKTAEGRMQLWVLAAMPLVLIVMLNGVSEGYFAPLTEGIVGYIVIGIATSFWAGSLIVARKILAVDI